MKEWLRDKFLESNLRILSVDQLISDDEVILDFLTTLEEQFHLETWQTESRIYITLTDSGARLLGLRLQGDRWAQEYQGCPIDEAKVKIAKNDWPGEMRCDRMGYPQPTILIGFGMIWDSVIRTLCPACMNRPLGVSEYCLVCDRWGLDQDEAQEDYRVAAECSHPQEGLEGQGKVASSS